MDLGFFKLIKKENFLSIVDLITEMGRGLRDGSSGKLWVNWEEIQLYWR